MVIYTFLIYDLTEIWEKLYFVAFHKCCPYHVIYGIFNVIALYWQDDWADESNSAPSGFFLYSEILLFKELCAICCSSVVTSFYTNSNGFQIVIQFNWLWSSHTQKDILTNLHFWMWEGNVDLFRLHHGAVTEISATYWLLIFGCSLKGIQLGDLAVLKQKLEIEVYLWLLSSITFICALRVFLFYFGEAL